MQITREKTAGIAGTILFAVLLLLVLLFSYFTLVIPPDELEGIPVMFGNVEEASGTTESPMNEISPAPAQRPSVPEYSPEEPLITQQTEPTIDVAAQREAERRKAQLAEQRRLQEEAARRQREEDARRREIN
ncbi:MAG: hypothetical protein PHW81_08425, partial [Petrimonas sp.]|nr:hypothetical protein [Petrimonas sp.]